MNEKVDSCPTLQILSALLEGDLSGEPTHELRDHVENCRNCQQHLESLLAHAAQEFAQSNPRVVPSSLEEDFLRTLTETACPLNWNAEGWLPRAFPAKKPRSTLLPPALIPGYELLEELGRGGMGVVYKARQVRANRIVALKMILAAEHARPEDLLRFRTEAEAPARLRHPNIIQIFEVADVDNRPYFSMEFADRLSLADKLQGIPLPPYPAAAFVSLLADALHYAHVQGVIHRDLKPANVLLQSPPGTAPESNRNPDNNRTSPPGST
ncbi:hypothetical protein BH10PLA2_BH10PLA2_07520 [soil metagenome]